jgi:hypothetical protein
MGQKDKCVVYSGYCDEHGFAHGAEAQELRSGIEQIIRQEDPAEPEYVFGRLQELLDSVDARDSLAYLETPKKRRRRAPR